MQLSENFLQYFQNLEDPRVQNQNFRHNLEDILTITILAVICGADNWVEINDFGNEKRDWLETFLGLPNGIPSHDTFGRVFSRIKPSEFDASFSAWINSLPINTKHEVIAIDGKTLRGSGNKRKSIKPLHLVSAWASNQNLMLGQVRTEEKSNEITAIPKLLKMVDIQGATVTIDAMGCQKSIAQNILDQDADYVLSLKKNHPTMLNAVEEIFALGEKTKFKKMLNRVRVEKVKDHGRTERRRYTLLSPRDSLPFQLEWPNIMGIGLLEVKRVTNGEVENSRRYFITSHAYDQIDIFMEAARKHWGIEIGLHWSLDVSFREDLNRARVGHSSENLATIRRIALNLLKQETTHKRGIACKRKKAGWGNAYLLKVLTADRNLEKCIG